MNQQKYSLARNGKKVLILFGVLISFSVLFTNRPYTGIIISRLAKEVTRMKTIIISFCLLLSIGAYSRALTPVELKLRDLNNELNNFSVDIKKIDSDSIKHRTLFGEIYRAVGQLVNEKINLEQNLNQCIQQLNRQHSQQ